MDSQAALDAFRELLGRDREAGEVRSLEEYQARFVGHEEVIAEEFARLQHGETLPPPPDEPDDSGPDRIGPYEILEVLGQGGMGTVYKAEQRAPVRRLVALKVIKLGMDSDQVLARFELERRALAAMSHGSIAKVYDCGTTDRGQPYFVMELVEGLSITDYCDKHRLSIPERLVLFQEMCSGVQHAHQKGVIHRDLKPGNVMVVREMDRAVPKILDFGLAKATNRDLLAKTIYTEREQILGTPEYMAPEQAALDHEAIDTRADIYSLGVMLYELLTGELPFTSQQLRKAGWLEMQRVLAEDEPSKPSTKLSTLGERATTCAKRRRTSPSGLVRGLRGDLDWIVLKAMAKEPERRYPSAVVLAMDLQRHLDHDPVVAGPPSAGYRMRKLMRRYRVQVVAGSAVLITAVTGALVAGNYAVRAEERAIQIAEQKREIQTRQTWFDRLVNLAHLRLAREREEDLVPAWPEQVDAMRRWLSEDARTLSLAVPDLRAAIQELRARVAPRTEGEREASRLARHPELARLRAKLAAIHRMHGERDEGADPPNFELDPAMSGWSAKRLNDEAWPLVDPDREEWGREAEGLALARLAFSKAAGRGRAIVGRTLSWALYAAGKHDEAVATAQRAMDGARRTEERAACKAQVVRLRREIDVIRSEAGRKEVANLVRRVENLASEFAEWRFTVANDFLHHTLTKLVADIEAFEATEVPAVEVGLRWAKRVKAVTVDGFSERWSDAQTKIRKADGVGASALYRTHPIDLGPQMGLVPIGMNPRTKLWEFYHLRSAWDSSSGMDPADIPIPEHREDGSIEVTGDTGIVFVLLPGGSFTMGRQNQDPSKKNYDEDARTHEFPPHPVTLAPFFLARHEMTQGQWKRLSRGEEPSEHKPGMQYKGNPDVIGYRHPVELVNWIMCRDQLREHGLRLPTEAQWEYGARASSPAPWFMGTAAKSLDGFANVLDLGAVKVYPQYGLQEGDFNDSHAGTAPVGSFEPNKWGLYDVHGNVAEWCQDWYGDYRLPTAFGDGLRQVKSETLRVYRGGSWGHPARFAKSAFRNRNTSSFSQYTLGLRPARPLIR